MTVKTEKHLSENDYEVYADVLRDELVPALGCTEPIAIALASARAASLLEGFPERIVIGCSNNILKNVMSVVVPNSGGMRGLKTAAILGAIAGYPEKKLEVLDRITDADRALARTYIEKGICSGYMIEDEDERLLIRVKSTYQGHVAEATIAEHHTNFVYVALDGKVVFHKERSHSDIGLNLEKIKQEMTLEKIVEFADTVELERVTEVLDRQIVCNCAISREGLENPYGAQIGRTLLKEYGRDSFDVRARAYAAAASEARMSGCSLPVVINSGSGNQGITVSVPVVEYARTIHASEEQMLRAVIVSNLVSIHLKSFIGDLSAFCGAVTAASGAGAAIAYLNGSSVLQITKTVETTLASSGGIICDGAKSSCAAKIATALEAAFTAQLMSKNNNGFQPGEGIICADPEQTFENIGKIGRDGMAGTDAVIFDIMLGSKKERGR